MFETTSDPFGALNTWNESIRFCQWFGVTCGCSNQRLIVLNLDHQKLTGSISRHIGNLSFLNELSLSNNSRSHKIPLELSRFPRLQKLSLLNNSISSEIPANIFACSNLIVLEFSGNRLGGKIRVELGSLSKLKRLYIRRNNLTGSVPSSFGNLLALTKFVAEENSNGGDILDALGRLTNLEVFLLRVNSKRTGEVNDLSFLYSLTNATNFNNEIVGIIPTGTTNLINLQLLDLSNNNFTGNMIYGDILLSFGNLTVLANLTLCNNNPRGRIPSSLGKCQLLQEVRLVQNNLSGTIPSEVLSLSSLMYLYISRNDLTGSLPMEIGILKNLEELDVSKNMLAGEIPSTLGKWNVDYHEYGMGNEESTFGDVYSYGILLLEMFTGKRPTDNIFCDSLGLHSFVKIALLEHAASIIADPRLFKQKDQSSTNSHKIQECLISILKVGITCSEESPKDPMAINDIGTQLQVIRNTLVGTREVYMEVGELKLKCNHEQ
ncbi:unnamed protein product [Camellia sinensis]